MTRTFASTLWLYFALTFIGGIAGALVLKQFTLGLSFGGAIIGMLLGAVLAWKMEGA